MIKGLRRCSVVFCIAAGLAAYAGEILPVWAPPPAGAGAGTETARVLLVDFGQDNVREGDASLIGSTFTCYRYRLEQGADGFWRYVNELRTDRQVEVDGDPATADGAGYYEFSLEKPGTPRGPWFDSYGRSSRFFGGAVNLQANAHDLTFHERGVNDCVEGAMFNPRDNWSFFYEHYDFYSPYRLYLVFLWKKSDFLNGGDTGRVSLDADSSFHIYIQRYYMGLDGLRMVVQDGDRWFISEKTIRRAGPVASYQGMLHHMKAGETRWAAYQPSAPYQIEFDPAKAVYEPRTMNDVQAVGFYDSKHALGPAFLGFKFYAFEVNAMVERPRRPSETMNLAEVKASGVPPFYMSATEVPYVLWNRIYKSARDNCFAELRGFNFDRDGEMGSMSFPDAQGELLPHDTAEPVTAITLHDAAVWCNAVSLFESRTPCYYLDPEFKQPLHEAIPSPAMAKELPHPPLYVKWAADGYRLPTPAEFCAAYGKPQQDDPSAKTRLAGGGTPNTLGLYDLSGNVREMVWTWGDRFDPATDGTMTVMGGDFRSPEKPVSASARGEKPWNGLYCIGFRPVRREAGLARPPQDAPSKEIPSWTFSKEEVLPPFPKALPVPAQEFILVPGVNGEVGTHEVSYTRWREVFNWAVSKGYAFDHGGHMGSMSYWGYEAWQPSPTAHQPTEPVTDVTAYDVQVWCNALSEREGRRPVYYEDEPFTKPLRSAYRHRPLHLIPDELAPLQRNGMLLNQPFPGSQSVFMDAAADGYRIPTGAEFKIMAGKTRYVWGQKAEDAPEHAWLFENSGGRTHPVGMKKPTVSGLYDVNGNVNEWCLAQPNSRNYYNYVRCGGSFLELTLGADANLRETNRGWAYPDLGFRLIRQKPAMKGVNP